MPFKQRNRFNAQIYEEACEWFLEFRSEPMNAKARSAFDRWIRRSPEHLASYLEAAAIWNEGPELDPGDRWNAATLVEQAKTDNENVVSLAHGRPSPIQPTGAHHRHLFASGWFAFAAAVCIAVCATLVYTFYYDPGYVTGVGEQRSIKLEDGSTVQLNSRSKLKVRYTDRERSVELVEGQALFSVAKESVRPFVVSSGVARVRAVGTQFDVYRKTTGVRVTVIEGRVQVGSTGPRYLSAGEQATITADGIRDVANPNVAAAIAWLEHQLIFDSASMAEVAEEFNRYNQRQLVVRDPDTYDFHVSGVFSSADPGSLIRFLRERPGVRVTQTKSAITVEKAD